MFIKSCYDFMKISQDPLRVGSVNSQKFWVKGLQVFSEMTRKSTIK
jgi:hypothetical protein